MCIDPSPTAIVVTHGSSAVLEETGATAAHAITPAATAAARRHHLRRRTMEATIVATSATAVAPPTVPTGTDPPKCARLHSTSPTCIAAGVQTSGPAQATSDGHASPRIAFGYATTRVADESGAHTSVSSAPKGCTVPKCIRTIGALVRNAAAEAAMAAPDASPRMPTSGDGACPSTSRGSQPSHRDRMGPAR